HHYQLATWIGGDNWTRYQAAYRTLTGQIQYGGLQLQSSADVTFTITDIDLAQVIADQYAALLAGGGLSNAPLPPPTVVTKFTLRQVSLPSFAVYAPINAENLNLTLNYTLVSQPPQGELLVQALSGASGGLQPVLPQN